MLWLWRLAYELMKKILITILLVAFLSSCASRKVAINTETVKTETVKETEVKIDSVATTNIASNTNINVVESANEIIVTPVDPTKEARYNAHVISNATLLIRNRKTNSNTTHKDTVSQVVTNKKQINIKEANKTDSNIKKKSIIKTQSLLSYLWWLLLIVILYLVWRFRKLFSVL